jgi:hypothetical protein
VFGRELPPKKLKFLWAYIGIILPVNVEGPQAVRVKAVRFWVALDCALEAL